MAYTECVIHPAIDKATSRAGFASLSTEQRESIARFVSGKDVFVSLPTGAGKSICYMLLPLVFDLLREVPGKSIIIVVSPLKSLMDDQVARLSSHGIMCVGKQRRDAKWCGGGSSQRRVPDRDVESGGYVNRLEVERNV